MTETYPIDPPSREVYTSVGQQPQDYLSANEGLFTGAPHPYDQAMQSWVFQCGFVKMRPREAGQWKGFFRRLRPPYGTMNWGDPRRRSPRGTGTGTPLVKGASQSGIVNVTSQLKWSEELWRGEWTLSAASLTANSDFHPTSGHKSVSKLLDSAANSTHSIAQSVAKSAAATRYMASIDAKASNYSRLYVRLDDGTSTNRVDATFNLSTGAIATAAAASGSFTNARAMIVALDNGYYRCVVIGTSGTEATIGVTVMLNNGSGTTFAGTGSSGILIDHLWLANVSLPIPYIKTQDGQITVQLPILETDGWTVSIDGILEEGDYFSIDSNLYVCTERVYSDASGNASILMWPNLRKVPADNATITITNPMGVFRIINAQDVGFTSDAIVEQCQAITIVDEPQT